jgi:RNA polymerase sigma-70 factor (ECF subfamily)
MSRPLSFPDLAARLQAGDPDAAGEIVRCFAHRLTALARRRLAPAIRPRVDPEDVVQFAFFSFFQRQARAPFALDGWNALWRLLACFTIRRCARKARHALYEQTDQAALAASIDRQPTPEEAACAADTVAYLLQGLSEQERAMFELRRQGWSSSEVAQHLGCTERTVQRLVKHLRGRLRHLRAATS